MEIRPILLALLRNKTGPVLVAVQVAISLAILANALHIVQVRQAVSARASGIANEQDVFMLQISQMELGSHQEQLAIQQRDTARLRAVAGVLSVAAATQMPLSRGGSYSNMAADRKQLTPTAAASVYLSADSLVRTWGLQLVEGRDFQPDEVTEVNLNAGQSSPRVAIISRRFGEKMWPGGGSYTGKPLFFGTGETASEVRVIGVVEKLQTGPAQIDEQGEYSLLLPTRLTGLSTVGYTLRAEPGQLDRVMKEAEAAVLAASPATIIVKSRSMNEIRAARYRADQALAWMLVAVSVLLLLVTGSGIVGMASLWVAQRRKQIGVRRALGARKMDIVRYFVMENFMITSAGVGAGVLLALALNQLLVGQLEMARLPAAYLVRGAAMLWALGVLAVYGPAARAASISPAIATRTA